ncbi:MAG: sigma-54-dependent Fis family transcriptional regulator [bacterium]|nr:sigma-54-dependent Fis family transcriptional regulator [bacterium]
MAFLLVVDDEIGIRESLRMLLKNEFEVATCADVESALEALAERTPDLIILDLVMPGRGGMDFLREMRERGSTIPVVVLTASNTIDAAVGAMKEGAADFITKPYELDALQIKIRQLIERGELEREVVRLRDEVAGRQQLGRLVGRAPAMLEMFRTIERVADSRASVLISGESGTGKELVAQAIHELGPRKDAPFIAVNCGAIPHDLMESELFGHEKGAFTGASEQRIGFFEAADGGTLLLDEIGELDPSVQVKLLRALQERKIERLGNPHSIDINVRIVAATNRDLEREIQSGQFRQDLYYRVNVISIEIPPLRERREDIRLLAESFRQRIEEELDRKLDFEPEVIAAIERYAWPGNVRELENAIERGAALCEGEAIRLEDLPDALVSAGRSDRLREDLRTGTANFDDTVARFECELILEALERQDWNQTRTADDLGITRRVLKLKMDRYVIQPRERRGDD